MIINRHASTWLAELQESLELLRSAFPQAHIYALIEGVLNESCYPFLQRSRRLSHIALYAHTPAADEETLCVSPILVEYRADEQAAWNRLLMKTDGLPALSIIATTESLADLANRLIPWCVVDAAGYRLALSFADTRILPELFKVLTPQQVEQLCGPMLRWQYVMRDAAWKLLPLPAAHACTADQVVLDQRQCAHLTDAAEADNVLFQLRAVAASIVDCHSPDRAYALVRHWLACADHAQIHSAPERRSLCEWGLSHPGFENHAQVNTWLQRQDKPQSLDDLLQQWQASATAFKS